MDDHFQSKSVGRLAEALADVPEYSRPMAEALVAAIIAKAHVFLTCDGALIRSLPIGRIAAALGLSTQTVRLSRDTFHFDIFDRHHYVVDAETNESRRVTNPGIIRATDILLLDSFSAAPPSARGIIIDAMIGQSKSNSEIASLFVAASDPSQEGNQNLSRSELDAFDISLFASYPNAEEMIQLATYKQRQDSGSGSKIDITSLREAVRTMPISDRVIKKVAHLIQPDCLMGGDQDFARWLRQPPGPSALDAIVRVSKAHALIDEATTPSDAHVKRALFECLPHRIELTFEAEADGITAVDIISRLLENLS